MSKLTCTLALTATLLAAAGPAAAASDFLLELDGIKGESKSSASIQVFEWSEATAAGVFNPFTPAFAGGVRVASGDLDGDGRWESLTLTARTLDGGSFFRYELKDVLVTSYSVSGHRDAAPESHRHEEWIIVDPVMATMAWAPPTRDGARGPWVSGSWDQATGRFLGDETVLGAFDDLGAVRLADGSLAIAAAVPEPESWALMLLGAAALGAQRCRQRRQA